MPFGASGTNRARCGRIPNACDRDRPARTAYQMTDTTTPASGSEPLRAVVENYGTAPRKPDVITPELEPWAQKVLAIDPIRGVPGNVRDDTTKRPAMKLKIDALPPEMRSELYRQLELRPNMPPAERAQLESKLVEEAVYGKLGSIRAMAGVRSDASPYHKEMAEIAGQVTQLQRRRADLQAAVDDIAELRKGEDPQTGELVAVPVYRMGEERRQAYTAQIADLTRQMSLLIKEDGSYGIEGAKRMREALAASAAQMKRAHEQREDEAEAQRRAATQIREARINERAEQLAKMRTGS